MNKFLLKGLYAFVFFICLNMNVIAEDAPAEGEEVGPKAIYLPIKPAFVVNYGGAGRLKYIKAEVTVRLDNAEAAIAARHHIPLIRNNIVMLFASQTDESISSQLGKEKLRLDALEIVREVLKQEELMEPALVLDLLFTVFIVQK